MKYHLQSALGPWKTLRTIRHIEAARTKNADQNENSGIGVQALMRFQLDNHDHCNPVSMTYALVYSRFQDIERGSRSPNKMRN